MFQTWVESLNLWGLNFALKILLQLYFVLYGSIVTRCSTGFPLVFRWYSGVFCWCSGQCSVVSPLFGDVPVFRVLFFRVPVYMVLQYAVAKVKVKTDTKAWLKLRENRNYMKWKSNWNYLKANLHETTWNIWFENINQTKSTFFTNIY